MDAGAGNQMRWSGEPGWYEVWFVTTTHRSSKTGFWIRYTLTAPAGGSDPRPYCQIWFACFQPGGKGFAVNRKLPIESLRARTRPFAVSVGDAWLRDGALRGSIEGHGHQASWDLAFEPEERPVMPLPGWAYPSLVPGTKFVSPNFSVPLRGHVVVDGTDHVFAGDRGTQCHLFGNRHAEAWAWGHVSGFAEDEEAALDVLSVRLGRSPFVLPPLTLVTFRRHGVCTRFADIPSLLVNRGHWESGTLSFSCTAPSLRVRGRFWAARHDMVTATYRDPDGTAVYCNNSEVASAAVTVERRGFAWGWEEAARLSAPGTAHFEHAARVPDTAVARSHLPLEGPAPPAA